MSRIEAALIGAYVADAAALGFHWLYDPDRIADLAGDTAAFRPPDAGDFEGYKGVFVHPEKRAGDLSQYGVQMRVAVQTVLAEGRFDLAAFQDHFAATFGAGGAWVGYMDKATKGTLANLAADRRDPSGADDDQVPAIAKLPPLVALGLSDTEIEAAIRATNNNDTAIRWSRPATALLRAIFGGAPVADALTAGFDAADAEIAEALRAAITTEEADTVAFAGEVGRACPMPQSMPVIFHIAARAESYRDAIERNIRAGGDNCGRAPVLGAVFGASHGIAGQGVPLDWIGSLTDIAPLSAEIARFSTLPAIAHG